MEFSIRTRRVEDGEEFVRVEVDILTKDSEVLTRSTLVSRDIIKTWNIDYVATRERQLIFDVIDTYIGKKDKRKIEQS
jgi:hypothetical protein